MTNEPTLGQVRDELVTQLNLDARVRGVEVQQAEHRSELSALRHELRTSKTDILSAIEAIKPKPIWPAVSAIVAAVGLLLIIFGLIYAGAQPA